MKKSILLLFFLLICLLSFGQKKIEALRTTENIKIDGFLNEAAWSAAPASDGFIQTSPDPGKPSRQKSKIRILYDDKALYVGAILYDTAPDSILTELTLRDNSENDDWFGVFLNPYDDGLAGTGFSVTAAGVQMDGRFTPDDEDMSYDLVWASEVQLHDSGWTVEMRIPYSAIRFPKSKKQRWAINFIREIRRYREESWWNEVTPDGPGVLTQMGYLTGIENIEPPVRLSFTPYISSYVDVINNPTDGSIQSKERINGGMDLKYGINDAFTLDMTLIPDFGQVEFDEQVLNLSPFEVRFDERRQFFTEGVQLFNRGDIFYSRRIGGKPFYHDEIASQLKENETLTGNPRRSQLINATKISGRNSKKLGVGFFNAVENRMYATAVDDQGHSRQILSNPLSNYNILVLDQALKNNSYVAFINTNVWREGAAPEANVSAGEFELRNKTNTYSGRGGVNISQHYYPGNTELGLQYQGSIRKISGNFQFNFSYFVMDDNYDQSDLGFQLNNNTREANLSLSYNIYEPKGSAIRHLNNLNISYNRLYNPNALVSWDLSVFHLTTFQNFLTVGSNLYINPGGYNDYFDPRKEGYFYHRPANAGIFAFFSPDYRKKFVVDIEGGSNFTEEKGRWSFFANIAPRFRFSNQFFSTFKWSQSRAYHDVGYATFHEDKVIFGQRNQLTLTQSLIGSYIFNNKMGMRLKLRHYWSKVKYFEFYELLQNGQLAPTDYRGLDDNGNAIHNTNFNALTLDLGYSWRFAPGSDLSLVWKVSLFQSGNELPADYFQNWKLLSQNPSFNSLSLKVIYYIDYLSIREVFR